MTNASITSNRKPRLNVGNVCRSARFRVLRATRQQASGARTERTDK